MARTCIIERTFILPIQRVLRRDKKIMVTKYEIGSLFDSPFYKAILLQYILVWFWRAETNNIIPLVLLDIYRYILFLVLERNWTTLYWISLKTHYKSSSSRPVSNWNLADKNWWCALMFQQTALVIHLKLNGYLKLLVVIRFRMALHKICWAGHHLRNGIID